MVRKEGDGRTDAQPPREGRVWKYQNLHEMKKRKAESFIVNRTLTERYLNSAIPQMQRMLNCYQKKQNETLSQLIASEL